MVLLQNTMVFFLVMLIAPIPTRVFPAPQGSTMTPERPLFSMNTLDSAFS